MPGSPVSMQPTEMMIPLHASGGASCKVSWRMGAISGRAKHPAITLDRGPAKESLGSETGFELQCPDHPGNQRSSWITMTSQGTPEEDWEGQDLWAGKLEVGVIDELSRRLLEVWKETEVL